MSPRKERRRRPAETSAGIVGAITTVVAFVFRIKDAEVLRVLPIIIGAIPGAITWVVSRRWESDEPTE